MRILIVEDDKQVNKGLIMAFEKESFAADGIYDGKKAERHILLNHENYDLIILDMMLEGKSGIELCIKAREASIFTPILMLTGVTDTEQKVAALNAGADDYVTKPFSIDELIARVRALLRRPREVMPSEVTHGPLKLNFTNKEVLVNGNPVKLTLKEFAILEYMMLNANSVLSRDQILDHVWNFEANAFSNIVDVHVTNLRKKFQQAGLSNIFETIRGVGFKIAL